ncbi:flavin reductase family protein [Planctomicrobium sp. SH664]|uniref:flavin reductase family protein n=1 Tax=Planctomicrobium sp. SH664 TaxID=3448125 RepID=UPI003F5B48C9
MNHSSEIAPVLGRIPSGVFILTARSKAGEETGMLASWVQQSSFEPPTITVALNQKRFLNDWLSVGAPLVVNLVGETQKQFLSHFGKGFEPGVHAFQNLDVVRSPAGLPVLTGALGWLEAEVQTVVDCGDHRLYLARVQAAGASEKLSSEKPFVHIRKNGFGY